MASLADIPGLQEAEAKYESEQLEAFAGVEPDICGAIQVLPMTPQMRIELEGAGNGFFVSTEVNQIDVAVFLWRVSPAFSRTNKEARQQFNQFVSVLLFEQAVADIKEYLRRSMACMPQYTGGSGSKTAGVWPSRLVDIFASEYGWDEEYTLSLPFRRLFQYENRIMERNNSKYTHKCPKSLRLRKQWLLERKAAREASKPAK